MSIQNIAFTETHEGIVTLDNFNDKVVVRLRIPDAGKFVVFGRVVITNYDGDPQNANARLTTFDGATEIDRVNVRITRGDHSISLQGTLSLPSPASNNIVDIRCATYKGLAREATLFAISVDDLSIGGLP